MLDLGVAQQFDMILAVLGLHHRDVPLVAVESPGKFLRTAPNSQHYSDHYSHCDQSDPGPAVLLQRALRRLYRQSLRTRLEWAHGSIYPKRVFAGCSRLGRDLNVVNAALIGIEDVADVGAGLPHFLSEAEVAVVGIVHGERGNQRGRAIENVDGDGATAGALEREEIRI